MTPLDPASATPAALSLLRAAFVTAQSAPSVFSRDSADEQENTDISTPRARAAAALESVLRARRAWSIENGQRAGSELCSTLIEMCAWHEHPQLRGPILAFQMRGLALLEAAPATGPSFGDVGDLQDDYARIRPREDDAEAIAAALGLSPEQARAFGLVGTLTAVGVDDSVPASDASAKDSGPDVAEAEETLEDVFRRESLLLVTRLLPRALQQLWGNPRSMDALMAVRRGFHTLKGDARVTAQSVTDSLAAELLGLSVLAEAAEDVIDMLLGEEYDSDLPAPVLPAGAFSLLQEAADSLVRRLETRAPVQGEASLLQRLYAMQRKAASISGTPLPEELTHTLESTAPAIQPLTTKLAMSVGMRRTSNPLLPTFLEESERLIADLHRALAALSENPSDEDALVRARVKLHTLKGGAALLGEEAADIQRIAHSAEDLFELIEDYQLRGEMTEVPRAVLDGVLDAEEALQTLLDILKLQSRSGRLTSLQQLSRPPEALVAALNTIAARVRSGEQSIDQETDTVAINSFGMAPGSALGAGLLHRASIASVGSGEVVRRGTGALDPARLGTRPLDPARLGTRPLGQARRSIDTPSPSFLSGAASSVLRTLSFRDFLDRMVQTEIVTASMVAERARAVEESVLRRTTLVTLYTCVQYLSSFVRDIDRYRTLSQDTRRIAVLGKPDMTPAALEGITVIPLAPADPLSLERVVIVDSEEAPVAFLACPLEGDHTSIEPRYRCAFIEDPTLVREAVRSMRLALQTDAALIDERRAAAPAVTTQDVPRRPALAVPPQAPPQATESSQESGVKAALELLEDLSVKRDALQDLISRMSRQSGESRRSTRRLRALIERVTSDLADLRSELARTTGKTGDWDLLEKEEYTAFDVLLMQLDEALADLEESDTNLRRDLGEAQAQMESQAAGQLRAQRALLNVSMVPLSQIEDRLAFTVRSQSRRLNKQVHFALEGGDLLLDGRIAESLFDPLMHLINNAIDHGIEDSADARQAAGKPVEGHVTIRGRAAGDGVVLEVIDDGRGIDPAQLVLVAVQRGILTNAEATAMSEKERLALIWRVGFSTARAVSTVSGRGIGMKSVRDDVGSLQGRIDVHSVVGEGTTFSLRLPRSLAMLRVEIVREGHDLVAIPITQLVSTHPIPYQWLETPGRDGMVRVNTGDRTLAVYPVPLASGLARDGDAEHGTLLELLDRSGGIVVDEVLGSQYLPVRPVAEYLRHSCALIGHAVGSGGRILPIIDVSSLLDRAVGTALPSHVVQEDQHIAEILVVDDSPTMRRALSDTLRRAGYRIRTASDGREALTTCTTSMPDLITLDMEMPGMDGLEALSAIRVLPNGSTVPVFMITSRQQPRHRAAALAAGVTRYFTKPYDGEELIQAAQDSLSVQSRGSAVSSGV